MATVEMKSLSKSFGTYTALDSTDLRIEDGEFVVVVGPSGCGKSTLLRLIAGLETADAGRVLIDHRDVTTLDPAARGVAMVFQSYALYPHLTVAENIAFPLRMAKLGRAEIAAKVARVADMLELSTLLDRRPRALSGGQRQRVSIGRAIVRDPAVLLLDEPLSNLDAGLRVRMRHELARLHHRLGATMIHVTHDQAEAMTLANRIVVMSNGRVEQVGEPIALYERPATLKVAEAIGAPAINLLSARVAASDPAGATVTLSDGVAVCVAARLPVEAIGAQVTLGVRPEHLCPDLGGPFRGTVELFERLGPQSFAHLGHNGGPVLVAQLPADRHVTLGETICFSVAPDRAQLFDPDGAAYPRISP